MTQRSIPTHATSLPPNLVPGGHYVRMIANDSDMVIVEHPLPRGLNADGVEAQADRDYAMALGWLHQHPTDVVYCYLYDGDDGSCTQIHLMAYSDVHAHAQGREPEVKIYRLDPVLA